MTHIIVSLIISLLSKMALLKIADDYLFRETFDIIGGWELYLLAAGVFALVNGLIRPVLKIVTLPIHFITLGLSSLTLNGVCLWLWQQVVNTALPETILITSWYNYLIIGILLSILSAIIHRFIRA